MLVRILENQKAVVVLLISIRQRIPASCPHTGHATVSPASLSVFLIYIVALACLANLFICRPCMSLVRSAKASSPLGSSTVAWMLDTLVKL